ncbi:MAG: hypothetical protein V4681_01545 [Patescibacteria group bacterium]
MPRARSTDKFYIRAPLKSGSAKGKRALGTNPGFHGNRDSITLQDLLNFLHKHGIDPSQVSIPRGYMTLV